LGTAARLWNRLEPTAEQYRQFLHVLALQSRALEGEMELCYIPFDVQDGLRRSITDPPATLLVLPNGCVKVAAALPLICADLRRMTLAEAWNDYRAAWRNDAVIAAVRHAIDDESFHAEANTWQLLPMSCV